MKAINNDKKVSIVSETNPKSFENKVKSAIEATGLPTEISATKILTDNGWQVQNEYPAN